jgi:phosphoribosylaminoimidazolecarboxamide formyltransferase/IMP cyclohydrolase
MISNWFAEALDRHAAPSRIGGVLKEEMRYGENPHQKAGFYVTGESARAFRRRASCRASSSPTTTSTTPTPPSNWSPSSCRKIGGLRHHQARQSLRRRHRPSLVEAYGGRSPATAPRPSAASSRSTRSSMPRRRKRSSSSSPKSSSRPTTDEAKAIIARKKNLRLLSDRRPARSALCRRA